MLSTLLFLAGSTFAQSLDLCPGLPQVLAALKDRGEPSLSESVDAIEDTAQRQIDAICAAAIDGLGSLYLLERSRAPGKASEASELQEARRLAENGWQVHPNPTGALIRAVIGEVSLTATPDPREVEAVSRMWVDAVLTSVREDGWGYQPTDLRRCIVENARRFALEHMGRESGLDRAAWAALRTLLAIAAGMDRPTDEANWLKTFPEGQEPTSVDKADRKERALRNAWTQAIPPEATPEGRLLAAAAYWRELLYRGDSSSTDLVLFIDPHYIVRYDLSKPEKIAFLPTLPNALDDLVLDVSDTARSGPTGMPMPNALVTVTPESSHPEWTVAREGELAALRAHALVRDSGGSSLVERWVDIKTALDLTVVALEHAPHDQQGPISVDLVGEEVSEAIIDALTQPDARPEWGEEVAEQLMRLAPRSPEAGRALLIVAIQANNQMSFVRRYQLTKVANDTAWEFFKNSSLSTGRWLVVMASYLSSAAQLNSLASENSQVIVPVFQLDPTEFTRRVTDPALRDRELGQVWLPCSALPYLAEVTDLTILAKIMWLGIGDKQTLPGGSGVTLLEQLSGIHDRETVDNCSKVDLPQPLPTSPRVLSAPEVSDAERDDQMEAWLGVSLLFDQLAADDPARLGAHYAMQALTTLLVEDWSQQDESPTPMDVDILCTAALAMSIVEGPEAARAVEEQMKPRSLDGCPSRIASPGSFVRMSISSKMRVPPTFAVRVEGGAYAGELTDWLTADFMQQVPAWLTDVEQKPPAHLDHPWKGPLVPRGRTTTLQFGDVGCLLTPSMINKGLTVYQHPYGCIPGLPANEGW